MLRFYTDEALGPSQGLTKEGFLIAQGVPIARTGIQVYGSGEVPVDAGPDGRILIDRSPEEVFRPETIASFEGKPITLDHPISDVTIDNWRELACGHAQNIRRGDGALDDLLLGDLVITCPNAISAVRSRDIRQVSAGYDADYESTGPGRGRQTNIIGNHIALVNEARCGPRCSIGDHACDKVRRGAYDAAKDFSYRKGLLLTKDAKQSQQQVNYTTSTSSNDRCGVCKHFNSPDSCQLVEGVIEASGWCKLFDRSPIRDAIRRAFRQDSVMKPRRPKHLHIHI